MLYTRYYDGNNDDQLFHINYNNGHMDILIIDYIYHHTIGDMKRFADLFLKIAENQNELAIGMMEIISKQFEKEKEELQRMENANKFPKTYIQDQIGDCLWKLDQLIENHGELTWYGGLCDENYVDGEYIEKSA